jgi:hypothetical protein
MRASAAVIPRACLPGNFVATSISSLIRNLIPNSAATRIGIADHRDEEIEFGIKPGTRVPNATGSGQIQMGPPCEFRP